MIVTYLRKEQDIVPWHLLDNSVRQYQKFDK